MYIFRLDLKFCEESDDLKNKGKLFQSLGAATVKALSPWETDWEKGTVGTFLEDDLRTRGGL